MKNLMRTSKLIYEKLKYNNVKDVFMYSGGSIMPLIDEFYKGDIKYYVNTHEQNCGHAATGYAKSTGNTGVSIVLINRKEKSKIASIERKIKQTFELKPIPTGDEVCHKQILHLIEFVCFFFKKPLT